MMRKLLFVVFLFCNTAVIAQPQLEGGLESFIKSNLHYPAFSLQNCVEGIVTIAFQLNKDGEVISSAVQSGLGTDLDDEALRIIRKSSGKWKVPASFDTKLLLLVPVNFKLEGFNCALRNKADIQGAISSYQAQKGLTDAILNFYKKKEPGKVYPEEERFVKLKKELGYDEVYMEDRISEGRQKLKEGDQQGACEDFLFVKHMGFSLADDLIGKHCQLQVQ